MSAFLLYQTVLADPKCVKVLSEVVNGIDVVDKSSPELNIGDYIIFTRKSDGAQLRGRIDGAGRSYETLHVKFEDPNITGGDIPIGMLTKLLPRYDFKVGDYISFVKKDGTALRGRIVGEGKGFDSFKVEFEDPNVAGGEISGSQLIAQAPKYDFKSGQYVSFLNKDGVVLRGRVVGKGKGFDSFKVEFEDPNIAGAEISGNKLVAEAPRYDFKKDSRIRFVRKSDGAVLTGHIVGPGRSFDSFVVHFDDPGLAGGEIPGNLLIKSD